MSRKTIQARLEKLERKLVAHKAQNEMNAAHARLVLAETKLRILAQLEALSKLDVLFDPKRAKDLKLGATEAEQVSDEVGLFRDEIKDRIDSMKEAIDTWQDAADGDAENDFELAKMDLDIEE